MIGRPWRMLRLRFDRGTLVVVSRPADCPAAALAAFVLDGRDGSLRAPAAYLGAIEAACASAGIPVVVGTGLPSNRLAALAAPDLRGYQSAALAAWELADRRGIVVLPTGAGKTRLALAAIVRARVPTLCVVPTRVLLHQWIAALVAAGFEGIGRLGDGVHDPRELTVATFESAYRAMPRLGDRFELLVVDEVHHFGLGVRDELLAMSTARQRLGLTATPRVLDDGAAPPIPHVGPIVFELGLGDLVGSHLAPFVRSVITVALDARERTRYEAAARIFAEARRCVVMASPGCTYRELVGTLQRSEGGRRALLALAESRRLVAWCAAKRAVVAELLERHRAERVLVFTPTAEVALALARELLVSPITAEVGRAERELVLGRFRAGEIRAIVSAQVLNEGLDVPDAEIAIVVGGVRGTREHVQRVGRVLRPANGKRALVYELVCRGTHEIVQARSRGVALGA